MKTDYYELLGVSTDATSIELKKSYRKLALRLHPDKNPDDIERATELFNEIRLAYETLSDPQERSWYDSHKYQILMEDDDVDQQMDSQGDEVYYSGTSLGELNAYMNPNLYKSFDDSVNGFYAIVSVILDKLASEEVSAGKNQNLKGFDTFKDDTSMANVCDAKELLYPRMGNSHTKFEDVRFVYKVWGGFQSVKSFAWCDEYRYSSAPDRRTRRLMEKENKKLRDQARKEFNETVRKLISLLKKMDPRMSNKVKKKFEKQKQAQKIDDLKRQAEIDKQNRQNLRSEYFEQDWQTVDPDELAEIEEELARIHDEEARLNGQDPDENEDQDDNLYECIICNKTFKSEKQFQDHERSKKHLKLLKQLQEEMRQEGIELGIDDENYVISGDEDFEDALENLDDLELDELDDLGLTDLDDEELDLLQQELDLLEQEIDLDDFDEDLQEALEDDLLDSEGVKEEEVDQDDVDVELEIDDDFDDENDDVDNDLDDTPPPPKKKKLTKEEQKLVELEALLGKAKLDDDDSDDDWGSSKTKNKKKKSKKSTPTPTVVTSGGNEKCSVCQEVFSSRNKLFAHVNETGHAAPQKKSKKSKKKK